MTDDDLPALIAYGKLFICEWAKYSQRWVYASSITKVALVKYLVNPLRGPCKVSGLVQNNGTLWQDVPCGGGATKQKHTLHHEFLHIAFRSAHVSHEDPGWAALNDPSFSYKNSAWDIVDGWAPGTIAKHPRQGFVSAYATQNQWEDQAETYAAMFVKEEYPDLVQWIAADPVLKSKVEYLKQFIAAIDPAMDGPYLERAGRA
jgi:hypothetical protein